MAKPRPRPAPAAETFDDLLDKLVGVLPATMRVEDLATSWGINPKSLFRLRRGLTANPHHGTLKQIADGMTAAGLAAVDVPRVRAAVKASFAARGK